MKTDKSSEELLKVECFSCRKIYGPAGLAWADGPLCTGCYESLRVKYVKEFLELIDKGFIVQKDWLVLSLPEEYLDEQVFMCFVSAKLELSVRRSFSVRAQHKSFWVNKPIPFWDFRVWRVLDTGKHWFLRDERTVKAGTYVIVYIGKDIRRYVDIQSAKV